MTQMYMFTSPMARKKRADCHFDPNTYRVISQSAEVIPELRTHRDVVLPSLSSSNLIGQPSKARPESEHRHNRPNPHQVNFLRHDVRLLNEPVCDVKTKNVSEQSGWWHHQNSGKEHKVPAQPKDTTIREDYQYRGSEVPVPRRFGGNTRASVARGIVPVTHLKEPDGKPKYWKEGISYEHQFNSRVDPQYPIRSKRHGAFVWDRMQNKDVENLLAQHSSYQQTATDASCKQEPKQEQIQATKSEMRAESSKQHQQHVSEYPSGSNSMPTVAV